MLVSDLEMLTFEALQTKIRDCRAAARNDAVKVGWDKLLGVIDPFLSQGQTTYDPVLGSRWFLARVKVKGYQGISSTHPLQIDIKQAPGITIIHGANGSGKSSLSDAIETALRGTPPRYSYDAKGGNTPLWERLHCNRDATQAEIELHLASGSSRLLLTCRLDQSGSPLEWTAQRHVGREAIQVPLEQTTWQSALAAHRPVFAYASLERQVQRAKDLQDFLESLLAFGGCFETLRAGVETESTVAKLAHAEWTKALKVAQAAVASVDAQYGTAPTASPPPISWSTVEVDPDDWLRDLGLGAPGSATPQLRQEQLDHLTTAATETAAALERLQTGETSLHAQLAVPLKQLQAAASPLSERGATCPVCATDDIDWFTALSERVSSLANLATLEHAFTSSLRALHSAADQVLQPMYTTLAMNAPTSTQPLQGQDEALAFSKALERDGLHATPSIRTTTRKLCSWVQSSQCREAFQLALSQSDRQRLWQLARRGAIDPFVRTWLDVGDRARTYPAWQTALMCLGELQDKMRKERTAALQALTSLRVKQLLADAGLAVTAMTVQGTKATIGITDSVGQEVTLAMLSAGQRNALLLSPLLASAEVGPFAFLVLDDPVHALDEMRVDLLARTLHEIAATRRVIVLTHDERLREYLRMRDADSDVCTIRRAPLTGVVSVVTERPIWEALLDDAAEVIRIGRPSAGGEVTPSQLVRGLCRQALDDAIREGIMQACSSRSCDPRPLLSRLDKAYRTRDRLATARTIVIGLGLSPQYVEDAQAVLAKHFDSWNRSAHGADDSPAVTPAEVKSARQACKKLAAGAK